MKRLCAILSITLLVLQVLIVPASWIISAVAPSSGVHSLISEGGIRWLVGQYSDNVSTSVLVYIIIAFISYNMFVNSGLLSAIISKSKLSMQQKFALRVMAVVLILFITALAYLTITPHAVLLSVTGNLFPSSFSDGLIPLLCFEVFILSLIYGIFGGTITSINGFWNCVTKESNSLLPVLFLYLLSIQLYHCFVFVFG